jgi:segregation and condensation protein A
MQTESDAATLEPQEEAPEEAPYEVRLEVFEGPLDLLLYLIRKDELDIYHIPVAHITARFLRLLEQLQGLDLEHASEFILMAATLMKIKSQMILPREDAEALDEDGTDPRQELVRRLLEYQQFKEIAEWLGVQREAHRDVYLHRQGFIQGDDEPESLQPVSLFDLLRVYKHVLDTVPDALVHRIIDEQVTIEECVQRTLAALERRSRVRFYDLIHGGSKERMIAAFIGILELLKSQQIHVQQAAPFEEIWIEKRDDGDESRASFAAAPGGAPELTAYGAELP